MKERKECFLANYMLLRTEREKNYHFFPNKKLFLKKRKQNERKEGIFPRELYTPTNIERERERKYHFSSGCSPNEKLSKERKRDERGKGRKEKERRKRGREGKRRGEGEFLSSRDSGGNRPVTTQISPIRIPGTATREYPQAE